MNNSYTSLIGKFYFLLTVTILLSIFSINASARPYGKIVIDPGHGGYDPGVVLYKIVEKEINLDISKRLEGYLKKINYMPIMTRKSDKALSSYSKRGNTQKRRDLNARVNTINQSGAKLFISIHVNSAGSYKKENGTIVYYNPKNPKSKKLAESLQKSFNNLSKYGYYRKNHKPVEANFYILKNSNIPGVLIETAFASNKYDRSLLYSSTFKNRVVQAIVSGIKASKILAAPSKVKKVTMHPTKGKK